MFTISIGKGCYYGYIAELPVSVYYKSLIKGNHDVVDPINMCVLLSNKKIIQYTLTTLISVRFEMIEIVSIPAYD